MGLPLELPTLYPGLSENHLNEMEDKFRDIRAYRVGWLLTFCDFLFAFPLLSIWAKRTTEGIQLDYMGDRKQIEKDIKPPRHRPGLGVAVVAAAMQILHPSVYRHRQ